MMPWRGLSLATRQWRPGVLSVPFWDGSSHIEGWIVSWSSYILRSLDRYLAAASPEAASEASRRRYAALYFP